MESYKSQEEVIARKAKEKGISLTALHAYFDRKIEQVTAEFPRKSSDWRLGRAEYLIWEHFCKSSYSIQPRVFDAADLLVQSQESPSQAN